jgi:hypothetical protein
MFPEDRFDPQLVLLMDQAAEVDPLFSNNPPRSPLHPAADRSCWGEAQGTLMLLPPSAPRPEPGPQGPPNRALAVIALLIGCGLLMLGLPFLPGVFFELLRTDNYARWLGGAIFVGLEVGLGAILVRYGVRAFRQKR